MRRRHTALADALMRAAERSPALRVVLGTTPDARTFESSAESRRTFTASERAEIEKEMLSAPRPAPKYVSRW